MDRKEHWDNIYKTKDIRQVSWFSEHLGLSLEMILNLKLNPDSAIIDIGGGAANLADDLLDKGFSNVTVLDVSETALGISKDRLGERADKVKWIAADILTAELPGKYDLWHDRAVFHFLTEESERNVYKRQLDTYLNTDGYLIISVFADDGPMKCSGLNVRRHSEQDFREFLGESYKELIFKRTSHITPSGTEQRFITAVFQKLI